MHQRSIGRLSIITGLVGALCFAGAGCKLSVNWGDDAPNGGFPIEQQASTSAAATKSGARSMPRLSQAQFKQSDRPEIIPVPALSNLEPMPHEHTAPTYLQGDSSNEHVVPAVGPGDCGAYPPTEKNMVILPPYRIEPPDILIIDSVRLTPRPNASKAQPIAGEHLVRPDGSVSLGTYGAVTLTGMTLAQAKAAIEKHLETWFVDPEVTVDVFAYNSKAYYVIADGGGFGMSVNKFPITGNERVLDAIERIGGLPTVSSRRRIWVARPGPVGSDKIQILPVDWRAIAMNGAPETNYQLFPGDRIYISADKLTALDNWVAKIVSPIERILGVTLLGSSTVRSMGPNGNAGLFFAPGF